MFGIFFDCLEKWFVVEYGVEVWDTIINRMNQSLGPEDENFLRRATEGGFANCRTSEGKECATQKGWQQEGEADNAIRTFAVSPYTPWSINRHYDDRLFFNLAQSAADHVGLSLNELTEKTGYRFFEYIRSMQDSSYDHILQCQGRSLREWISHTNDFHTHLQGALEGKAMFCFPEIFVLNDDDDVRDDDKFVRDDGQLQSRKSWNSKHEQQQEEEQDTTTILIIQPSLSSVDGASVSASRKLAEDGKVQSESELEGHTTRVRSELLDYDDRDEGGGEEEGERQQQQQQQGSTKEEEASSSPSSSSTRPFPRQESRQQHHQSEKSKKEGHDDTRPPLLSDSKQPSPHLSSSLRSPAQLPLLISTAGAAAHSGTATSSSPTSSRKDRMLVCHRSRRGNILAPIVVGIVKNAAVTYFNSDAHFELLKKQGEGGSEYTVWRVTETRRHDSPASNANAHSSVRATDGSIRAGDPSPRAEDSSANKKAGTMVETFSGGDDKNVFDDEVMVGSQKEVAKQLLNENAANILSPAAAALIDPFLPPQNHVDFGESMTGNEAHKINKNVTMRSQDEEQYSVSLSAATVKSVFPFHIAVNTQLQIVQVGCGLQRVFEGTNQQLIGAKAADWFRFLLPSLAKWDWEYLVRNRDSLFELQLLLENVTKLKRNTAASGVSSNGAGDDENEVLANTPILRLYGGLVLEPHSSMLDATNGRSSMGTMADSTTAGGPVLVFLLQPNINSIAEMMLHKLTWSDFGRHSSQQKLILLAEHLKSETEEVFKSKQEAIETQQSLEMKRMFVRYVSHEIRTPLNTVAMGLELLKETISCMGPGGAAGISQRSFISQHSLGGGDQQPVDITKNNPLSTTTAVAGHSHPTSKKDTSHKAHGGRSRSSKSAGAGNVVISRDFDQLVNAFVKRKQSEHLGGVSSGDHVLLGASDSTSSSARAIIGDLSNSNTSSSEADSRNKSNQATTSSTTALLLGAALAKQQQLLLQGRRENASHSSSSNSNSQGSAADRRQKMSSSSSSKITALSEPSRSAILELVDQVRESCDIAVNILNDLLFYEKLEGGITALDRKCEPALSMILDAVKPFQIQAKQARLELECTFDAFGFSKSEMEKPSVFIDVDKPKLSQVVRNMVSNAIKFSQTQSSTGALSQRVGADCTEQDGGSHALNENSLSSRKVLVHIAAINARTADAQGEHPVLFTGTTVGPPTTSSSPAAYDTNSSTAADLILRVQVIDCGPGISTENQKKLFNDIIQFDPNTLQGGGGSGLGLYISKGIMDLHGGRIGVYSEGEGSGGSCFYIDLPAHKQTARCPLQTYADPSTTVVASEIDSSPSSPLVTAADGMVTAFSSSVQGSPSFQLRGSLCMPSSSQRLKSSNDFQGLLLPSSLRQSGNVSPAYSSNALSHSSSVDPLSSSPMRRVSILPPPISSPLIRLSPRSSIVRVDLTSMGTMKNASRTTGAEDATIANVPVDIAVASAGASSKCSTPVLSLQHPSRAGQRLGRTNDDGSVGNSGSAASSVQANSTWSMAGMRNAYSRLISRQGKYRLLVVDDSMATRKMLIRLLERAKLCSEVTEAEDGQQALDIIVESLDGVASGSLASAFDGVLMDFVMPVMDGPTSAQRMREAGYAGPIIGITGNVLPEDIETFTSSGANVVLGKPLQLDKLRTVLAAHIKKSARSGSNSPAIGFLSSPPSPLARGTMATAVSHTSSMVRQQRTPVTITTTPNRNNTPFSPIQSNKFTLLSDFRSDGDGDGDDDKFFVGDEGDEKAPTVAIAHANSSEMDVTSFDISGKDGAAVVYPSLVRRQRRDFATVPDHRDLSSHDDLRVLLSASPPMVLQRNSSTRRLDKASRVELQTDALDEGVYEQDVGELQLLPASPVIQHTSSSSPPPNSGGRNALTRFFSAISKHSSRDLSSSPSPGQRPSRHTPRGIFPLNPGGRAPGRGRWSQPNSRNVSRRGSRSISGMLLGTSLRRIASERVVHVDPSTAAAPVDDPNTNTNFTPSANPNPNPNTPRNHGRVTAGDDGTKGKSEGARQSSALRSPTPHRNHRLRSAAASIGSASPITLSRENSLIEGGGTMTGTMPGVVGAGTAAGGRVVRGRGRSASGASNESTGSAGGVGVLSNQMVAPIAVPNYENYGRAAAAAAPSSTDSRGSAPARGATTTAGAQPPRSLTGWVSARLQSLRSTLSSNTRSTNN